MRQKDDSKIPLIYNATLQLVLEEGLTGSNMCTISKTAGIATGTLYIYFTNKEELITALFTKCRNESAAFYLKDYNPEESFERNFRKIFMNVLEYRRQHFREFVFLEQCYHSPFISADLRRKSLKKLQALYLLMDKGKKEGIIKDLDNALLLGYFLGAIGEVVKRAWYNKQSINKETIDSLYHLCLDGLKKK